MTQAQDRRAVPPARLAERVRGRCSALTCQGSGLCSISGPGERTHNEPSARAWQLVLGECEIRVAALHDAFDRQVCYEWAAGSGRWRRRAMRSRAPARLFWRPIIVLDGRGGQDRRRRSAWRRRQEERGEVRHTQKPTRAGGTGGDPEFPGRVERPHGLAPLRGGHPVRGERHERRLRDAESDPKERPACQDAEGPGGHSEDKRRHACHDHPRHDHRRPPAPVRQFACLARTRSMVAAKTA